MTTPAATARPWTLEEDLLAEAREALRALLDILLPTSDSVTSHLHMLASILAIEAQAAEPPAGAVLDAPIGAVIDRWHHLGLLRFNSHDDGGDDQILCAEIVQAILAALRGESSK
jgi:hypothetical protein